MQSTPLMLADVGEIIPLMVIGGGLVIGFISIVFSQVRSIMREQARGRVQREIAAYVAEGSMTSDEGERLMRAAGEPEKQS